MTTEAKPPEESNAVLEEHKGEAQQSVPGEAPGALEEADGGKITVEEVSVKQTSGRPKTRKRMLIVLITMAVIAVLAGWGYLRRERLSTLIRGAASQSSPSGEQAAGGQKAELKVLYWQDPMHPAYRSAPGRDSISGRGMTIN